MLTAEEKIGRAAELRAMMVRGNLSDTVVLERRDEIEKVFFPLPPPWKWERLRNLTGLPCSVVGERTGIHYSRIRHWEQGGGIVDTGRWIDYAEALVELVREFVGDDYKKALVDSEEVRVGNLAVQAMIEQQRVTANTVVTWLRQNEGCGQRDIEALRSSIRITVRLLRQADKQLRLRERVAQANVIEEAEKEGRSNGVAGA